MYLLSFGLKDGKLLHIDDVETGIACGCVCPHCASPLVARNRDFEGRVRRAHFAHIADVDCRGASESALHRLAKEILLQSRQLHLPAELLFPGATCSEFHTSAPAMLVALSDVRLEQSLTDLRPDVVAVANGRDLSVEIRVTHEVDEDKRRKLVAVGMACVEIDLREFVGKLFTAEQIRKFLIDGPKSRRWVHSPAAEAERSRLAQFAATHTRCPHELGAAGSAKGGFDVAPCATCPCMLDLTDSHVLCTGNSGIVDRASLQSAAQGHRLDLPQFLGDRIAARPRYHRPGQWPSAWPETAWPNSAAPAAQIPSRPAVPSKQARAQAKELAYDPSQPVASGRTCINCGKRAIGYAGRGGETGRVVWVCSSDARHPRFAD